jgi:hypothetical protein
MARSGWAPDGVFVFAWCAACGKTPSALKCGKCGHVQYCGVDCQKAHWPRHGGACGRAVAELVSAAPMDPEIRRFLVSDRPNVPETELGTIAALAETLPWLLHVLAACSLLGLWDALEELTGEDRPLPGVEAARARLRDRYTRVVATCPGAPDPCHDQTRGFLSTLAKLHPRIRELVMDITLPWFDAMLTRFTGPAAPATPATAGGAAPTPPTD